MSLTQNLDRFRAGSPVSDYRLQFGAAELPVRHPLSAGPLSMYLEDGAIRTLRYGATEVVRSIYVAVRDRDWGTVPAFIRDLSIDLGPEAFRARFFAEHRANDIAFDWEAEIIGGPGATVSFSMRGRALSTFWKSRIGFCILHPIQGCSGRPCRVLRPDGVVETGTFPQLVAPGASLPEMNGIEYELATGETVRMRFAGDIFEMEDQRNWTDASYKTFCTPLRLPSPLSIEAGTEVAQRIALTITGSRHFPAISPRSTPILIERHDGGFPLPQIGLCMRAGARTPPAAIDAARALGLSHLRAEVRLFSEAHAKTDLANAFHVSRAAGAPLELALFVSERAESELAVMRDAIGAHRKAIARYIILDRHARTTSPGSLEIARTMLPGVAIGAGTNLHFADFNTCPPPAALVDFGAYSVTPQVHAFDCQTLVENLEVQRDTVLTARARTKGKPLSVGPVTLRPRFSADSSETLDPFCDPPADQRQPTLFAAGWTAGSIQRMAEAGVEYLSYYEIFGDCGVMDDDGVFPMFHVFADLGKFRTARVEACSVSEPSAAAVLWLRQDSSHRLLIASFDYEPRTLHIADLARTLRIRRLNAGSVSVARMQPRVFRTEAWEEINGPDIGVQPFEVITVDWQA